MSDEPQTTDIKTGVPLVFSFGDPEPVLDGRTFDWLAGAFLDFAGNYYRPPISLDGLAKLLGANGHHASTLGFKRDMLCKWYRPNTVLSMKELRAAAFDFVVLANAYFQRIENRLGGLLGLKRLPALMMRRGKDPDQFYQLRPDGRAPIEFQRGEVIHIKEPDVRQDVYGVPGYWGGIQSVLLAEDATLFRRKYFLNGSHMGYILVTTDAGLDTETAKVIEAKVKESKGPGNFRSLYINIPRTSSREPVKVIPVGDIASKDEFDKIKAITIREVLGMHRMQPGLAGCIPENNTGFGDLEKVMRVYCELEVPPLQLAMLDLNDHLPTAAQISFDKPTFLNTQN